MKGFGVQRSSKNKRAVRPNPISGEALLRSALEYHSKGDIPNAEKSYREAIKTGYSHFALFSNLGVICKNSGRPEEAISLYLKAIEVNPNNPDIYTNLGHLFKSIGDLDQAIAPTLKSLELKPGNAKALYSLGTIRMAQGKVKEAKKDLLQAVENNPQEYGAYYELSRMLKTAEEAEAMFKSINSARASEDKLQNRYLIEFALSNCLHKLENYDEASKYLELANRSKLILFPSNIKPLMRLIEESLLRLDSKEYAKINANSGKGRIFIVGMPRSGSTLLETILSMHQEVKGLGERTSLSKAIFKAKQQYGPSKNHHDINELYSQFEPIDSAKCKYTTDKQLYNFLHINYIAACMPAAKIIHCQRSPMDNILSMYRSNLMNGNNYTASLEDSAKVLVAQEEVMRTQKKNYPEQIFTFDYDQFVNEPRQNLSKLLDWLGLDFDENFLCPEKSTRIINTASVFQARNPISNKSVGGWINYRNLLMPALEILQESGATIG